MSESTEPIEQPKNEALVQQVKEADFRAKLCAKEIDRILAEYKCTPQQQIIISPLPL